MSREIMRIKSETKRKTRILNFGLGRERNLGREMVLNIADTSELWMDLIEHNDNKYMDIGQQVIQKQ